MIPQRALPIAKQPVHDIDQPGELGCDARFFAQFAQGGRLQRFPPFQPAAGQGPFAHFGRLAAPDEQHVLAAQADNPHTDFGDLRGGFWAHALC